MIAGLLCIGLILISSALKNTQHEAGQQFQTDLLGTDGFLAWALAILAIGAIGYIPGLRQSSRYLLLLLGTVMVVRNGGVWAQAQAALVAASAAGPAPSVKPMADPGASSSSSSGSSSGGSSGGSSSASSTSSIAQYAELAAMFA